MATSIFSTYSTGENRVTASILAVLKSLSLSRIERLLGALLEQSEFELVRFQNQPAKGGNSVPDGEILGSCRILVETKIERNQVRTDQLEKHLSRLKSSREATRLLLVLTPDQSRPSAVDRVKNHQNRLVWSSFAALDQAIEELLADGGEVVSEREAFLLRELQTMLAAERLVGSADEVVIVAARRAWPQYKLFHAYVCQPGRAFKPVERIGFYSENQVYDRVPRILEVHDHVRMVRGANKGKLGGLVERILDDPELGKRADGHTNKVMLLSAPDDDATLRLKASIQNDLHSSSGRRVAFTMGQTYVSLAKLQSATTTSDLVKG